MSRISIPGGGSSTAYAPSLPQFHGVRYTAYGHSFGQVQATPNAWAGSVYTARLRDLLRADTSLYVNRTANGTTMTQIASAASSTWVDGNGGLVTLIGNQNSVGGHESQTTFKAAVRSFLTTMLGTTGYPPTVLVYKDTTCTSVGYARYGTPPTDADVAQYNIWLTDVVAEFPTGWIAVADPLADGWNPATMTAPDGQHPNDRGMALLAASGLKALAAVPYRRGLNIGVTSTAVSTLTNTVAPAISGSPVTGQILTASTGTWSATPDSYTYQWNRAGAAISGATASTYTLVVADEGQAVTVTVTAVKAGYVTGTATSASVTPTNGSGLVLTNTVAPAITGTVVVGQTLTVSNGTWSATPDSYTYQWKRAGTAISGATSSTYTLLAADAGAAITATVTAIKATYTSGTATSNSVTPTAAPVTDNFNRADGAGLGTATTGQVWATTVIAGTAPWAIASNQATVNPLNSTSEAVALVEGGAANGTVQVTMPTKGGIAGDGAIIFRAADSANYWMFGGVSGNYALYKRVTNTYTLSAKPTTLASVAGDVIKVVASGSTITAYVNGTQFAQVTDATMSTNTKVGLRGAAGNNVTPLTFDDFSFTPA